MTRPELSRDGTTLTVRVPFAFRRRSGRKLVMAPDGADWAAPRSRIDNTMVKALARAYRWQPMLESGAYASITELAEAERINRSYVCRVLRLTLLSPEIVEAILDGRQAEDVTLAKLLEPFPLEWEKQPDSFR